jgi:two-component sensor histidine kinase
VAETAEPVSPLVVEDLLPVAGSPRHARDLVTEACVRSNLTRLIPAATVIISELVSNVIDHAHTIMTVEVALRPSQLYLAVHDGSSAPPVLRRSDDVPSRAGRGLRLVAAFSTAWGHLAEGNGKAVWATVAMDATSRA